MIFALFSAVTLSSKDLRVIVYNMLDWISITNQNSTYNIKIRRPKFTSEKNSLELAHRTIDKIVEKYPPPYTLCISGGVDSQAMLYAWHTSSHSYKTFSVRYNQGMNDHDLITLEQFAKKENINVNYIDFDLLKFLETDYTNYVHTYRCGSPHFCTYMKFSELITEGTVLFSGTPASLKSLTSIFGRNELSLYRYATIKQRPMVGYFFCETEEITWSFNSPPKEEYSDKSYQHSNRNKIESLWCSGYPVVPQKDKITGFEKIKDYYDIHMKDKVVPKDKLTRGFLGSTRVFDLLLRNKYEEMYPDKYNIIWDWHE